LAGWYGSLPPRRSRHGRGRWRSPGRCPCSPLSPKPFVPPDQSALPNPSLSGSSAFGSPCRWPCKGKPGESSSSQNRTPSRPSPSGFPQGIPRDGEKLIGNHHAMGKESVIFNVEKAPKQERKQG